ncbi:toll-like receptor 5 [Brachionichthys hirsutus]|uniref:toll-like receptor 5 n=1 Tax=Brachionichthys hirsutus TaxID=412623 RepID=UPI0036049983
MFTALSAGRRSRLGSIRTRRGCPPLRLRNASTQGEDKMWTPALQLVFIGLLFQVAACYHSCDVQHLSVNCYGRGLYWVPVLSPNITHLYLGNNYIGEINYTSLRRYDQLLDLDLGYQRVPLVIRNNALLRQRKLTRLVLGYNQGLRLEPRAFAGLFNLKELFLDYCKLGDPILAEEYLAPLLSLETLDLFGNEIAKLRPGLFFSKLKKFTQLNLKLNQIKRLCEEDLVGFRGKYFSLLNLNANKLYEMSSGDFNWTRCRNPFRGMDFHTLDLSTNGFSLNLTRQFFKAIAGTPIAHLIFSGHLGKGFSHNNIPDPDESTFEGLVNSTVKTLDLAGNMIFCLLRAVFRPLKDAETIDVSRNKVNQINRNAFDGLQHLRMLNLSFNLLGEIYSHYFTNLKDLRVLDLSYNHIGVLGYKSFSGLPSLRGLFLRGNSLRELGSPASLPNLTHLLLGDNRLRTLSGISNLGLTDTYVDVTDNRLTNLEDFYFILSYFNHLKILFFGGNFIKWCTPGGKLSVPPNSSLEVLDLHDSSLQIIWTQGKCLDLFDHLEHLLGLNMSLNSLATLPQGIFSGLKSIAELDLSFNALTFLQPDVFPDSLKILYLKSNFLASPDPMNFQGLGFLSLEENRFYCNCELEDFLKWLNVTNVTFLSPVENYTCGFPAEIRDLTLLDYAAIIEPCEEDDEKAVQELKFALFILSALMIIVVILSGIIYARLRGQIFIIYKKVLGRVVEGPKPAAPPAGEVQYDAFLCFSNNDYRWVEAALLKKLDNQFSERNIFQCCFEARDFLPGQDHLSNIRDAIWGSRKTVCIISKEFLKDGWCLEAFTLAQGRMLEELKNVLIMLVVGKVAHYQLMKYNAVRAFVQRREYLTWPEDPQDLEWFYERLVSQILRDTAVKDFVKDNRDPAHPGIQPQDGGLRLENRQPEAGL